MADTATKTSGRATPYERDFAAWAEDQAGVLRARRARELDWENLAEEIESLGRSDKREIRSRLRVLIVHLMKWAHQPNMRSQSWLSSIAEQRVHIAGILEDSPSLGPFPESVLRDVWRVARRSAIVEAGPLLESVAETPEWPIEAILSDDFMPGAPWSPEDLVRD